METKKDKKRKRINPNTLIATTSQHGLKAKICKQNRISYNITLITKPKYFVKIFGELKEIKREDIPKYQSFEIIEL